jgi:hypothetical protein
MVMMMLSSIMETMGINILLRSVSMRTSPGILPNQFISHGAK